MYAILFIHKREKAMSMTRWLVRLNSGWSLADKVEAATTWDTREAAEAYAEERDLRGDWDVMNLDPEHYCVFEIYPGNREEQPSFCEDPAENVSPFSDDDWLCDKHAAMAEQYLEGEP